MKYFIMRANISNKFQHQSTIKSLIFLFALCFIIACGSEEKEPVKEVVKPKKTKEEIKKEKDSAFIAAVTVEEKDSVEPVRVSYPGNKNIHYEIDAEAGKKSKTVYTGNRVNIAITGVDGRLGTATKHADANHVISILLDSGKIEITSIPRDTPADAGYEDGHAQNKITIVRARKGRQAYLRELARIARVDKIHYYVEVGFSQVMGILDFLGYDDPASTLQVLRSRKALGGDDYQRVYSQGQFIRQMILRHFNKFTGISGEVIIRGGLWFVGDDTNFETSIVQRYIDKLEEMGFPKSPSDISVRVRPPIGIRYKKFDFSDTSVVNQLLGKIENKNKKTNTSSKKVNVVKLLEGKIESARKFEESNPKAVIARLKNYYNQKAWWQIPDKDDRNRIREDIANLMMAAYIKLDNQEEANNIRLAIEAEKQMFNVDINK